MFATRDYGYDDSFLWLPPPWFPVVEDAYTVRIYTSSTTHVFVDLTGAVLSSFPGPATAARRKAGRRSVARRVSWKPSRRR